MGIQFYKYQGTGNDFILIDNRDQSIALSTEQVKHLCDRRFGIGADGLMLLEAVTGHDFKMVYYNSDGNESTMCGNGGRCIVAFAKKLGIIGEQTNFLAIDGTHEARIHTDFVSLQMNDVNGIEKHGEDFFLNTGSPHYVKVVNDLMTHPVVTEGREIRYSGQFGDKGTNVNFIEKSGNTLLVRTYERGVEDETLSCGTGVTAAALAAAHLKLFDENETCSIQTPGGKLSVRFHQTKKDHFSNIWLQGPAEFVFEGSIQI